MHKLSGLVAFVELWNKKLKAKIKEKKHAQDTYIRLLENVGSMTNAHREQFDEVEPRRGTFPASGGRLWALFEPHRIYRYSATAPAATP